jgi:hypothetical protein
LRRLSISCAWLTISAIEGYGRESPADSNRPLLNIA